MDRHAVLCANSGPARDFLDAVRLSQLQARSTLKFLPS